MATEQPPPESQGVCEICRGRGYIHHPEWDAPCRTCKGTGHLPLPAGDDDSDLAKRFIPPDAPIRTDGIGPETMEQWEARLEREALPAGGEAPADIEGTCRLKSHASDPNLRGYWHHYKRPDRVDWEPNRPVAPPSPETGEGRLTKPYKEHLMERLRSPEAIAGYLRAVLEGDEEPGQTESERLAVLRLVISDCAEALETTFDLICQRCGKVETVSVEHFTGLYAVMNKRKWTLIPSQHGRVVKGICGDCTTVDTGEGIASIRMLLNYILNTADRELDHHQMINTIRRWQELAGPALTDAERLEQALADSYQATNEYQSLAVTLRDELDTAKRHLYYVHRCDCKVIQAGDEEVALRARVRAAEQALVDERRDLLKLHQSLISSDLQEPMALSALLKWIEFHNAMDVELRQRADDEHRRRRENDLQVDYWRGQAEAAEARAVAAEQCDVCSGTGKPISGKPCICGGTGKSYDERTGLRQELFETEDKLVVAELGRNFLKAQHQALCDEGLQERLLQERADALKAHEVAEGRLEKARQLVQQVNDLEITMDDFFTDLEAALGKPLEAERGGEREG